jgi:hypothetical protein
MVDSHAIAARNEALLAARYAAKVRPALGLDEVVATVRRNDLA